LLEFLLDFPKLLYKPYMTGLWKTSGGFKIRCLRAWRFKSAYWYHFYDPSSFAGVFLCLKKLPAISCQLSVFSRAVRLLGFETTLSNLICKSIVEAVYCRTKKTEPAMLKNITHG